MSIKGFFINEEKDIWSMRERLFKLPKYKRNYKEAVIKRLMKKHGWTYQYTKKAVYESYMAKIMDRWPALSLHSSPEEYMEFVEYEVQNV